MEELCQTLMEYWGSSEESAIETIAIIDKYYDLFTVSDDDEIVTLRFP